MIHPLTAETRACMIQMMREFYHSPAVLHPVPEWHFERTCDQVLSGSPFVAAQLIQWEEKPAGYGLLAFTYSNEAGGLVLWLEELYIRPAFRGKGLGARYFSYLHQMYDGQVARMRLEVEPENEGARRLYRRMGLQELPYLQMYQENSFNEGEREK